MLALSIRYFFSFSPALVFVAPFTAGNKQAVRGPSTRNVGSRPPVSAPGGGPQRSAPGLLRSAPPPQPNLQLPPQPQPDSLGQTLLARVAALNTAARDPANWSPSAASGGSSLADERPGALPIEADATPSEAGTLTLSSLVSESTDASMCYDAALRTLGPSFLPLATLFESSQQHQNGDGAGNGNDIGGEQQWRGVGGGSGAFHVRASPIAESPEREASPTHSASPPPAALDDPRSPSAFAPSASLPFSATGTSAADPVVGGDGDDVGEGDASFGHPSNEFAAVRSKMEQLSPASGSGSHSGHDSHLHVPLHFSHDYAVRPAHAYMTSDGPMA